jgi:hypothetical protein
MHKRPLQTVRQFYFVDIQLSDHIDEKALKTLSNTKLEQKLDKLLSDTVKNIFIILIKYFLCFYMDRLMNYLCEHKTNIPVIQNNQKNRKYFFFYSSSIVFLLLRIV